jgi:LiaI-LiaF-like transmembrane region/LiaF transmembrane domain
MKNKFPLFGTLLIVLGATLLLHKTGIVDFSWGLAFWSLVTVAGAFKLYRGFADPRAGGQFWGTVFFLLGLTIVMTDLSVIDLPGFLKFPLLVSLIGVAFLAKFAAMPREWHLLIPGILLTGLGSALVLSELDYLPSWEFVSTLAMYWPVALVLFGAALLLNPKST